MNVNSPEGRRARLEMWKGATGLPVGFPLDHLFSLFTFQRRYQVKFAA